jgi:anti-sigma factor ChrR (cupin superfamily)
MTTDAKPGCERTERVTEFALQAMAPSERSVFAAHVEECTECAREVLALRTVIEEFVDWPTDILRPATALWERLAERIGVDSGGGLPAETEGRWSGEQAWKEVAPGISCKLLATDLATERVSMLVRLAPGVDYPPHRHAGTEELHLLHGELWIDERKLFPGDYYRAEPGSGDSRVWSATGCTCVLMTSFSDVLG